MSIIACVDWLIESVLPGTDDGIGGGGGCGCDCSLPCQFEIRRYWERINGQINLS